MSAAVPDHIGPFLAVRHMGDGTSSEVLEGVHRWLRHPVALKLQRRDWVGDLELEELFLQEAHILRRLEGHGVPRLYDVGQVLDGRYYLASELLDGETFAARMARGMAPRDVLAVLRGMVDVLTSAHAAGITHRDLKPEHVMILPDGRVRLIDWGCAFVGTDGHPLRPTRASLVAGTPRYMAPEQSRGRCQPASDVYGLGVVAYEALTGEAPFPDADPLVVIERHQRDTPTPLRRRVPGISPLLERLVLAMLAKRPARRPKLAELHSALRVAELEDVRVAAPLLVLKDGVHAA